MLASLLEISSMTGAGHWEALTSMHTPTPILILTDRPAISTPVARPAAALPPSVSSALRPALTGTPLPSDDADPTTNQTPCPTLPSPTVTAPWGQTNRPQRQVPGSGVTQIAVLPSLTTAQAEQVLACSTKPSSSGSPPDESWIAFIRRADDYSGSLYLVHADGSGLHQLVADNHVSEARWSPNGRKMALVQAVLVQTDTSGHQTWHSQIELVNSDGTDVRPIDVGLGPSPLSLAWSPDSQHIAFVLGKAVFIETADGELERYFTYATAPDIKAQFCSVGWPPADGPDAYSVSWEPDGKRLALQAFFCGHAQYLTYLVNTDGTNFHVAFRFWDYLAWSPVQNRFMAASGWSGLMVLQAVDASGVAKPIRYVPTLSPPTGTGAYTGPNSCSGGSGAWSKDGQWFACASAAVDIVNANGDYQFTLVNGLEWTTARTDLAPISWSPDGRQIALLKANAAPDYGGGVLYVINTDGSNLRPLAAGVLMPAIMWQPPVK